MIEVKKDAIDKSSYDSLYSVEAVNQLVKDGTSFREAYLIVKKQIEAGEFIPDKEIAHTHVGSIGQLSNDKILKKLEK